MPSADVVIAMGPCGVGKSTLLNNVFKTDFLVGPGDEHVTLREESRRVGGDLLVIDTPGFDIKSSALPQLTKHNGKRVALVFLGYGRKAVYVREVAAALGVSPAKINFFQRDQDPATSLDRAWKSGELALHMPASAPIKNSPAKTKKIKGKQGKANPPQARAYQFFGGKKKKIPDNMYESFERALPDLEHVQKYRHAGDAVVRLYAQFLVATGQLDAERASDMERNSHMAGVLKKVDPLLCEYARKLYGDDDDLSDEKYADVLEAFIGVTSLTTEVPGKVRKAFVPVLRKLIPK